MTLRCKVESCHTHPILRDSGMGWPEDAICPVCDTLHDKYYGRPSKEIRELAEEHEIDIDRKNRIMEREAKARSKPVKLPPYMRGIHRGKP